MRVSSRFLVIFDIGIDSFFSTTDLKDLNSTNGTDNVKHRWESLLYFLLSQRLEIKTKKVDR